MKKTIITTLMLSALIVATPVHPQESGAKLTSLQKPNKRWQSKLSQRLFRANPAPQKSSATTDETIYLENFDDGAPGWQFLDGWSEAFWHTSTTGAFSGKSYWCGVEELGGYDDNWQQTLTSPPISLASTTAPRLSFMHHYQAEALSGGYPPDFDAWDAMTVRLSTDGTNFAVITPAAGSGYHAASAYGFNERFGTGVAGWAGDSGGWVAANFDLTAYAGQTIRVQFLFGSDEGWSHEDDPTLFGWRVDDIKITDGATTIFADDAGDTGPVQFVAGGPGGPNLWHLTSTAAVSAPNSAGCFDITTGDYLPGMRGDLISPAIAIDALPPNTQELLADFQLKGRLDSTPFPRLFGGVSIDLLAIEVRAYFGGGWSYWSFVNFTTTLPGAFIGFNTAFPENRLDVSAAIGLADSLQFRIGLLTRPDSVVVSPANLFIDDFSLTAVTATSVNERPGDGVPAEYWLGNNYPNPFNPQTTIAFALPERAKVVLTIHDVLGQEIAKLVESEMLPGYHQVTWDAKQHTSGVYFYRLSVNDFTQMKKMVLMK